tara:strand:+ start:340 stop:798 length:459 start_codon:yes stop_codon:yes gene_type:complete
MLHLFGQRKKLYRVDPFDLLLQVSHKVKVPVLPAEVWVAMLRDLLFHLIHKLIMIIGELGILADFFASLRNAREFIDLIREILDQGIILLIVNSEDYAGVCQFRELDGFLEKPDPPLLESDSAISLIADLDDLDFLSAHGGSFLIFLFFYFD